MVSKSMDNVKDNIYYVKRILKSVEALTRYLENRNLDDLLNDGFLRDAIENRFTKMSEDTSHIEQNFKNAHKEIPWGAIKKIRNTVCHEYDVVDASSLFKTIKSDFPVFRNNLLSIVGFHSMRLDLEAFDLIETRAKTVEMRLNDEKRKKLNIGDLIVFKNLGNKKELIVEIIDLKPFHSFDELYAKYPKKLLGYKENEIANPIDMHKYYSDTEIKKYGVLAIEIRLF
jgi:uncharacterized protein with HEPN domain